MVSRTAHSKTRRPDGSNSSTVPRMQKMCLSGRCSSKPEGWIWSSQSMEAQMIYRVGQSAFSSTYQITNPTNLSHSGSSIVFTAARLANVLIDSHQQFPPIPNTTDQFVSTGVRRRPTLFGCDPINQTHPEYPLVLYLPNSPPVKGEDPVTKYVFLPPPYSPKV